MTEPFREDLSDDNTTTTTIPDFCRHPYAEVEFLAALESATGKTFPAAGEELESADALQFLMDLCTAHAIHVAPPRTLPRVLGKGGEILAQESHLGLYWFFEAH